MAEEFNIENFAAEEKMVLDNITTNSTNNADSVLIDSSQPATAAMEIEMEKGTVRWKYI